MKERETLISAPDEHSYLVERLTIAGWRNHSLTGMSSDALVHAAFNGTEVHRGDYPWDRWDWRRCLLAYVLAPESVRERMRPTMRLYRESLRPEYRCWREGKSPGLADAMRVVGFVRGRGVFQVAT